MRGLNPSQTSQIHLQCNGKESVRHTAYGLQILFGQDCGRWLAAAAHWRMEGLQGSKRRQHPHI